MVIYYSIVLFIMGTVLGSFFTVVGERFPENKSIISPPSHCPNCNHRLVFYELIPIFSYLFLRGKCHKCKSKIPVLSTLIEILTGLLFVIAYLRFGLTIKLFLALVFISMLMIIIVSDIRYMIICDSTLIIGNILLFILLIIDIGLKGALINVLYGIVCFIIMFLIKIMGDFLFKKESMGGGDIKLMFTFGLVMGIANGVGSIFVASFVGFPISLILMRNNSSHEIPFGPYLSIGALILFLSQINVIDLLIGL